MLLYSLASFLPHHHLYTNSLKSMNQLYQKYLPIILAAVLSFLAPIATALIFVGMLVIADFITGLIKAHKARDIQSRKMIKKFYTGSAYLVVLFVVRMAEVYFGDEVPLVKPVVAMIALSELQSLRENVEAITGTDPLKNLFGVLQRKANPDA